MGVTHCVCHNISFEQLKRLADEQRLDIDGLREQTKCCSGCGMCEPYVRLMLSTGKTRFPVLRRYAIEQIMQEARDKESAGSSAGAASAQPGQG
jgi:bacterioferritin-associated ferredoxin